MIYQTIDAEQGKLKAFMKKKIGAQDGAFRKLQAINLLYY